MAPLAAPNHLRLESTSSSSSSSEFVQFRASMRLPIAPIWAADGKKLGSDKGMEGVKEVLAGWVMRYLPPLRAVLLTFDPLPTFAHSTESFPASASPFKPERKTGSQLLSSLDAEESEEEDTAATTTDGTEKKVAFKVLPMIEGSGFVLAKVEFQGMGWRPQVGQKIVGSPTLSTPSHISLLLHNLFNASIPVSHIPSDQYYFDSEYPVPEAIQQRQQLPTLAAVIDRAATEEPTEKGEGEEEEELDEEEQAEKEEQEAVDEEEETYRERGWWLHKSTGEPLGGAEGRIEFTIVGLKLANSLLSVTGSLLSDPFAPIVANSSSTIATKPTTKTTKKRARSESTSSSASDASSRSGSPPTLKAPPKVQDARSASSTSSSSSSSSSSSEEDSDSEDEDSEEEVRKAITVVKKQASPPPTKKAKKEKKEPVKEVEKVVKPPKKSKKVKKE